MKSSFLLAFGLAASAALAQDQEPSWALGKDAIDQASVKGRIELAGGIVKLDAASSFEIPASALGDQLDYSIEFEFRRGPGFANLPRMEGALLLFSNLDLEAHAGLAFVYMPPDWDRNGGISNRTGIDVNGYWNGETAGLDGDKFNKFSIVVKGKSASIYRNGLLQALTGEIAPSQKPLTIGGKGWRGSVLPPQGSAKPIPVPYELRNLKVYRYALAPTGFDSSAELMRNCSGDGYSMQRADIKDSSLPRILVVGDSISMGYRGFISEHFKGKAYVDYWVGGSWLDPNSVKGEGSPAKRSWKGVLSNGPYDVVSWNAMTLHMWNPNMPGRCPEDSYPGNMEDMVKFLKAEAPKTQFLWIRCTPHTSPVEEKPSVIKADTTERLVKYNKMTDVIMEKYGVPEVDLFALCENNLDKASKDGVHWNADASKLMAQEIIKEIEKRLPAKK
jgi:hypothetical protein